MKNPLVAIAAVILLLAIAAAIWGSTTLIASPPLPANLRERVISQDWAPVTRGNWSPWHTTTDGETTWDPVTSYNEWIASLPDDARAWPAIIDMYYQNLNHLAYEPIGCRPGDEDWDEAFAFLSQNRTQSIIEQHLEVLQRLYMGHGLYNGTFTYGVDSRGSRTIRIRDPDDFAAMKRHVSEENPQLVGDDTSSYRLASAGLSAASHLQQFADLLTSQSCLELLNGNTDRFIDLQQIIFDSARFCNEFPTDMNQLVANAIKSRVNETIRWAVSRPSAFSEDQLAHLDTIVARHESTGYNWHGESLLFHDTVRRLVNSSGKLIRQDYEATIDDLIGPPFSGPTENLASDVLRLLLLHELTQQSLADEIGGRPSNPERTTIIQAERPHLSRRADLLLMHAEKSQQIMISSFTRLQSDSIELRWSIAARRHELRHGEPPADQTEIDADLQPTESVSP